MSPADHDTEAESFYFVINTCLEQKLIKATGELHRMFVKATEHVINTPSLWEQFDFPIEFWEKVKKSFEKEKNNTIYGRFDFTIDKNDQLKCFEYNADSAGALVECGYVQ